MFGVKKLVDDDGAVKAAAAENKVAVKVKSVINFILMKSCCACFCCDNAMLRW